MVQSFTVNMVRTILGTVEANNKAEAHVKAFEVYPVKAAAIVVTEERNCDMWDFLDASAITRMETEYAV